METTTTKKKINPVAIKTKTDVQGTLLALKIGVPTVIKNTQIKACSIRSAIRKLTIKGYSFKQSEEGRIDDVIVTRLK
ncbi:hypothetical protein [Parabacteroides sp. AM08-6]|uniref:hypothetical protein n=1 Tax=Parabacteroides sp. AM08-6 TaxID=2292053 RepID=UPI000EFE9A9A|nr:hypothetical protein [Parabacteroides sp. AM08-6]RHJ76382.1 hypothetical protein DW103_16840 [Parabacteroides sp. AM08-6]